MANIHANDTKANMDFEVDFEVAPILKEYELSATQLLDRATPHELQCGIYFLIKGDEIVYIGQASNIHARVGSHADTKDFDKLTTILCPKEYMNVLETIYIQRYQPKLNYRYSRGRMAVPLRHVDVEEIRGGRYEIRNCR